MTDLPVSFPVEKALGMPKISAAPGHTRPGVRSFYFENEPYRGKSTQVFGWIGMPYLKEGAACPGMVLVHGGGGTASDEWVRHWNSRGYAAVAVDLCGCRPETPVPIMGGVKHEKNHSPGPDGWNDSFSQMDEPVEDHWQYHAVMAIVRAHSLLANTSGVDPEKIGITGISWGGYLTAIAMAVDPRLALAVPVYGCGYITENSVWKTNKYEGVDPKGIERWARLWDPMHYLPHAELPVLWVTGTNDFAYPLDSLQKSYQHTKNSVVSVGIELKHSHPDGWAPPEIVHFANSICKDDAPLPRFVSGCVSGNTLAARFTSERPIMAAELCYTRALGMWQDRRWNSLPAQPAFSDGTYELCAALPPGTTCAFFNVYDDRGLRVSSHHEVVG